MPRSLEWRDQPSARELPEADNAPARVPESAEESSGSARHPERAAAADRSGTPEGQGKWSLEDVQARLDHLPPSHPSAPRRGELSAERTEGPRNPAPDPSPRSDARTDSGSAEQRARAKPEQRGERDDLRDGTAISDGSHGRTRDGTPAAGGPGGPPPDDPGGPADPPDASPPGKAPDRQPTEFTRNYWTEVPSFLKAWAEHKDRWPAESGPAVDRSGDPPGSWRGDGNQYLNPEQHTQTTDVIARVRHIENSVTVDLIQVEQDNVHGGRLEGLEFRRKGEDRLKEKIATILDTSGPDATPDEVIKDIPDAIRYTFCALPEKYKNAYWEAKESLEAIGYRMIYSQNHWSDTQYKGINTRWKTSEGQQFEVQFHTAESHHAKQEVTHRSYERIRSPLTSDEERRELRVFQQEVCSWIVVPDGALEIPNYREGKS